jgi:transcriptional regulator with GAF, ATPase, and Fis domain
MCVNGQLDVLAFGAGFGTKVALTSQREWNHDTVTFPANCCPGNRSITCDSVRKRGDSAMKRYSIAKQGRVDAASNEDSSVRAEAAMTNNSEEPPVVSLREKIRQKKMEVERSVLIQALRKTGGNKAEAARLLQINYSTLHLKIKRYGIRTIP